MVRLGFHYHIPFHPNANGEVTAPGYLGRFLDSLAAHVPHLVCFMHSASPSDLPYSDYVLQAKNLEWVDIGPKTSIPRRMINSRRYSSYLRSAESVLDALLIRGPSPLLPTLANASQKIPVALLIVGDYLAGIDDLPQPKWRKEAIRAWSYWNHWQQRRVARRSLVFVNSHKLYEQLRPHVANLIETRTTTLNDTDFFEREDTCRNRPIRLLYTGRMDRAKGLFEMVEAINILVQRGQDVVLDLVGWPANGDTVVDELMQRAQHTGVQDRIVYHGFKAVGPELFAYYKQADIYVIASQSSEGFPRTIWEAMAHSLPVIAARVGSIPLFLKHQETAWLLEDASASAIADGVHELATNSLIRTSVIRNGRQLAKANTLEVRTLELVRELKTWIAGL